MADSLDKLTIETPELIHLEFPLAGIGSRFLALAVDTLIQFGIAAGLASLAALAPPSIFGHFHRAGIWLASAAVLGYFLLQFGYFAGFEAYWNGQTPGKRQFHLRVIKDSGRPINVYDSVGRNLLRIVDSLPGIYGVGIVSMLLSSKSQRLGDLVAGTVVVHERPLVNHPGSGWDLHPMPSSFGGDLSPLSPEEFQVIETFLARRDQLAPDVRREVASQIVLRVGTKLKITGADGENPEMLVEKLASEYRHRAQFR